MRGENCEVCGVSREVKELQHYLGIPSHLDFRVSSIRGEGIPTFTDKYLCFDCKDNLNG